jgi:hypothetical protein
MRALLTLRFLLVDTKIGAESICTMQFYALRSRLTRLRHLSALAATLMVACSSDDPKIVATPGPDGGGLDAGTQTTDTGVAQDAAANVADVGAETDAGAADAGGPRPDPVFVASTQYADYIQIAEAFRYGVTQVHTVPGSVGNARWGQQGPMVTRSGQPGPSLVRFGQVDGSGVVGASPTAALTERKVPIANTLPDDPPRCPAMGAKPDPCGQFFGATGYGEAEGLGFWSYTSAGANFPGRAILFRDPGTSVANAHANGIYDLTIVAMGETKRAVYTGLSGFASVRSTTESNGLYTSAICPGPSLTGAACAPSALLRVPGSSGPLDRRPDGSVVATFVGDSGTTLYAVTQAEIFAGATLPSAKPVVSFPNVFGSQSFAAVSGVAGAVWAVNKPYDDFMSGAKTAIDVAEFGKPALPAAIKHGPKAQNLDVFSDNDGDLWIAVDLAEGGVLIELRPQP